MSKIDQNQTETSKKKGKVLMIGFSFSLNADGSPGICNEAIAKKMITDIKKLSEDVIPLIGLQWEIYDAMYELLNHEPENYFDGLDLDSVVKPPRIKGNEIINPYALCSFLIYNKFPAVKKLYDMIKLGVDALSKKLETIEFTDSNRDELDIIRKDIAMLLNEYIDKQEFYKNFQLYLELHDLHRTEKGLLGLEKREMPKVDGMLRKYQARRVNRLILEAIFPEWILKRGEYLNAKQVAKYVLERMSKNYVSDIHIYAHPNHVERCKFLVQEKVIPELRKEKGILREWKELSIHGIEYVEFPRWNLQSAQVWCRSKVNYEIYTLLS